MSGYLRPFNVNQVTRFQRINNEFFVPFWKKIPYCLQGDFPAKNSKIPVSF
jgi:hypothetical protein